MAKAELKQRLGDPRKLKSFSQASKPPSPGVIPARPPSTTTQGVAATTAVNTLPRSLINALPVGARIAKLVQEIESWVPELERELAEALKAGPVQLARAFVVLHRLNERLLSEDKALKPLKALYGDYKNVKVPEAFEQAGVPNVPLDEGFRVGIAIRTVASIVPGKKDQAYAWLSHNDAGDLIQSTVNASTLSAFAKQLGENNIDLPEALFTVARMPNTSVTKI